MFRLVVPVFGALLTALALFATAALAQAAPTIPGGVYSIALADSAGGCSQGDLVVGPAALLRLNPHGTRVTSLVVNDVETPILDFAELEIPTDIPVGQDGRFDATFDPLNAGLAAVRLFGRFDGDSVTGTFSVAGVDALECAGTFSGQGALPPPGQPMVYEAVIDDVGDGCGSGALTLTVSGSRLSVIEMRVTDLSVDGVRTAGAATFAEGTVPVGEIGSFGWVYFPGSEPGQEIAAIGRVDLSGRIDGWLTVSPSTCGEIPFVGLPLGPVPVGGPQGPQRGGEPLLPDVGAGGPGDSGLSLGWALAAGAFGIVGIGTGVALRRRVR